MQIQAFLDELSRRLRDVNKRQWTESVLVDALNSAYGALCQTIPDAYVVHRNIDLVNGVEQTIPEDTDRLIRVLHNVAEDDSVGLAVREADMGAMDSMRPNWRNDTPREQIRHWFADDVEKDRFYVWPPVGEVPAEETETVDSDLIPLPEGRQLTDLEVRQFSQLTANTSRYEVVGAAEIPDKDVFILDISAGFVPGMPENDGGGVPGVSATNATGNAPRFQVRVNESAIDAVHADIFVSVSPFINLYPQHLDAAFADGRFYALMYWHQGSGFYIGSDFFASVDELPILVTRPGVVQSSGGVSTNWEPDVTAVEDFGLLGSSWSYNEPTQTFYPTAAGSRDDFAAGLAALEPFSYFIMQMPDVDIETGIDYSLVVVDGTNILRYTYRLAADRHDNANSMTGSASGFLLYLVAQPDGDTPGLVYAADQIVGDTPYYWDYAIPEHVPSVETSTGSSDPAHSVRATLAAVPQVPLDETPVGTEPVDPGNLTPGYYVALDGDFINGTPGDSAGITLSNSNYTWSTTGASNWVQLGTITSGYRVDGPVYWETRIDAAQNTIDVAVGIDGGTNDSTSAAAYLGQFGSTGLYMDGSIYYRGSIIASVPALSVGDVVRHVIDNVNDTYELAVNDGAFITVPTTFEGTGEVNYYGYGVTLRGTSQITLNANTDQFAYSAPDGAIPLSQLPVTQAQIDDYLVELAAFNASSVVSVDLTQDIPVSNVYINALFEYCLYYCYGIDDEAVPNTARANRHYLAFYQLLNKQEEGHAIIDAARTGDEP